MFGCLFGLLGILNKPIHDSPKEIGIGLCNHKFGRHTSTVRQTAQDTVLWWSGTTVLSLGLDQASPSEANCSQPLIQGFLISRMRELATPLLRKIAVRSQAVLVERSDRAWLW